MILTEVQHIKELSSYAHVKQHEQETTLIHNQNPITREFATGNKQAWSDIEFLLKQRLIKLEELE